MRQTIGTGTGRTASANAINREAGDTSTDYAPAFLRALGHLIEAAGLDKLDEAFLYSEAIDVTTYSRQRDKLREELTLAKIDHHTEAVDELDVEGILAFAERILPRASEPRVQASLDYKQRLQELFFPEGIAYDGHRFNRTPQRHHFSTTWRRPRVLMKRW
jgi:hypothetical protein